MLNVYAEQLTDEAIDSITGVYNDAYSELSRYLSEVLDYNKNPNFSKVPLNKILARVSEIINNLREDIEILATEKIEEGVEIGYAENEYAFLIATGVVTTLQEVFKKTDSSIVGKLSATIIGETIADLVGATENAEYMITQIIKQTSTQHLMIGLLGNYNKVMADQILKQITSSGLEVTIKNGIIGIVDKAGRRWKLNTYVDMLVKTKYHKARVEGMKEFYRQNGFGDLAVIPRVGSLDACSNYEGMVISLSGDTPDYPSYDELQSTNMIFHPRCRHIPVPIYEINNMDSKDYDYWMEHMDEFESTLEENLDDY